MFSIVHLDGSPDANFPLESLPALYDELRAAGLEQGSVTVVNEDTGWRLSAHRDGRLVLKEGADGAEQSMKLIPKHQVLQLWTSLIEGDMTALTQHSWTKTSPG
jgi:hypothetical protein